VSAVLLTVVITFSGLITGYLAQRSRMCFIAGFRDFLFVRDTELLNGLFSFLLTVWLFSSLFTALGKIGPVIPEYQAQLLNSDFQSDNLIIGAPSLFRSAFFFVTLAGGFILGLLSVFAGGCVMRQHVLFAQGNMDALYYLAGFYSAVVVYYYFLQPVFAWVYE